MVSTSRREDAEQMILNARIHAGWIEAEPEDRTTEAVGSDDERVQTSGS